MLGESPHEAQRLIRSHAKTLRKSNHTGSPKPHSNPGNKPAAHTNLNKIKHLDR